MHWPGERTGIQRRGTAPSRETGDGRDGQGGVLRPRSTDERGELGRAGTHGREGGNRPTYRSRATWRYSEIEQTCQRDSTALPNWRGARRGYSLPRSLIF